MIKRYFCYLMVFVLVSCTPTNWLKLEVLNPAEFSFPDSGKICILNASYLPSVLHNKSNLMTQLPSSEQFIFDTLITTNLFNGVFSVLGESPIECLKNAEYEELRTTDTTNFLGPISSTGIAYMCKTFNSKFIISLEYYDFNRKKFKEPFYDEGWQYNLVVPYTLIWRIYKNDGELLDQYLDPDTLYWVENINTNPLPELTDAVREVFYLAGEKYAKHISPYWSVISRKYFLLSHAGDDISLDKDYILILTKGKRQNLAYKACYNLAVLCESEDKLEEANQWLEHAYKIKPSEEVIFYHRKLENRLIIQQELTKYLNNF